MATSLNEVVIMGNVTAKPEIKKIEGHNLAEFIVAINRSRKDKQTDEWIHETDFIRVKAWYSLADYAAKIEKGERITVTGSLREERWEQDGKNRSRVVVLAQKIVPGGKPKGSEKFKQAGDIGKDTPIPLDDIPF